MTFVVIGALRVNALWNEMLTEIKSNTYSLLVMSKAHN